MAPADSQPIRRLAPQRRKKVAVSAALVDANSSNQNHLPINIDDDEDMICTEYDDDDHSNNDTIDNGGIAMKNVADWTTLEQQQDTNNNKQETVSIDNSSEEEEEEKEYHGEIKSITSTPDNNKLDTDPTSANDKIYEEEEEEIFNIQTEYTISLNPPPPTIPLVLVSLEELCGCIPESKKEKLILVTDLMDSLLGSTKDDDEEEEDTNQKKKSKNVLGDGLSLDFDERITELFDSNVASHVDSSSPIAISCLEDDKDTSTKKEGESHVDSSSPIAISCLEDDKDTSTKKKGEKKVTLSYAIIPYPEFLSDETTNPTTLNTTTSVRTSIRLWKLLYTLPTTDEPHISKLLSKIFCHLRNTSRSLLWKVDMYTSLNHISKSEYEKQIKHQQLQEYNIWKDSVRSEKLEKLYDVRDTFVLQVDVAKKRYGLLVEEREGRVDRELRRRGLFGEVKDTLHAENVQGSNVQGSGSLQDGEREEYDDDGWGGTICEDDILGEETNISRKFIDATVQEDEEFENDEWAPLETGINPLGMDIAVDGPVVPTNASAESQAEKIKQANKIKDTNKLEPISHDDNIKRKVDRKQRKQEKASRSEYLKREQELIRETLKSNDERIAEATLLKLEEKLQKVDNLLESLQEEEWADEEEQDEVGGHSFAVGNEDEKDQEVGNNGPMEGSLLNRILAMILGALPKEKDGEGNDIKTEKEHYVYIMEEHKSIVKEWVEVFGRMPSSEPEPEPQHEVWPVDDTFGDEAIPSDTTFLETKRSNDIKLIGNEDGNWDD